MRVSSRSPGISVGSGNRCFIAICTIGINICHPLLQVRRLGLRMGQGGILA
jgi:hypothetical protein